MSRDFQADIRPHSRFTLALASEDIVTSRGLYARESGSIIRDRYKQVSFGQ